jgi:hypothetical protein
MPTCEVMISCIATRSTVASSAPLPESIASSLACSRSRHSFTIPIGTLAAFSDRSQKSAMYSPTIIPATTVSATEFPPSRLNPCMSQHAASPAANRPLRVGLSPVWLVRTPPMV